MVRLLSGVLLAAAALAAILFLPFMWLRVLACVVAGLAADEYLRIPRRGRSASHWGVIAFVVFVCWWEAMPSSGPPFSLIVVTMFILGWLAFEVLNEGRTIQDAANDLVALVYVGLPLGMLVAIHARTGWKGTVLLIATIVVSDSSQYYSGRAFGRRPLAPTISPRKTIEGALGGIVMGTAFVIVAGPFVFPTAPVFARAFVGLVVVLAGICGDLFESRLKRLADMKDSSALIPGHGGVLDRIDALLFAIPVFYFMVLQGRVA